MIESNKKVLKAIDTSKFLEDGKQSGGMVINSAEQRAPNHLLQRFHLWMGNQLRSRKAQGLETPRHHREYK